MSPEDSFTDVRNGLLAGDPLVAAEIFAGYAGRLTALARSRLNQRFRSKLDPEDVTQSAFRSFFQGCTTGHFDIRDANGLWSLLVMITLRKCYRQSDLLGSQVRDVQREIALDGENSSISGWIPLPTKDPGPEAEAELAEIVQLVVQRLGTPLKAKIFEMSLQGYTIPEISEAVDFYERGVERVRAEARKILSELFTS